MAVSQAALHPSHFLSSRRFLISRFSFLISHFPFPISHFPFPISHFPFPISHFPFPISHFPFLVSRFPFLISFSGFQIPTTRRLRCVRNSGLQFPVRSQGSQASITSAAGLRSPVCRVAALTLTPDRLPRLAVRRAPGRQRILAVCCMLACFCSFAPFLASPLVLWIRLSYGRSTTGTYDHRLERENRASRPLCRP